MDYELAERDLEWTNAETPFVPCLQLRKWRPAERDGQKGKIISWIPLLAKDIPELLSAVKASFPKEFNDYIGK